MPWPSTDELSKMQEIPVQLRISYLGLIIFFLLERYSIYYVHWISSVILIFPKKFMSANEMENECRLKIANLDLRSQGFWSAKYPYLVVGDYWILVGENRNSLTTK